MFGVTTNSIFVSNTDDIIYNCGLRPIDFIYLDSSAIDVLLFPFILQSSKLFYKLL